MTVNGVVLNVLQALPYVMLLIAMLFFIYAIIGMQVFNVTCDLYSVNMRDINHTGILAGRSFNKGLSHWRIVKYETRNKIIT